MVCFAGHLRKILHRGLVFVCCCARSRNSSAPKLPALLVLSCQSSRCLLWVFVFVCVCFCCLVLVLCFWPDTTSDCVLVRTPLLTPQGGTLICIWIIRSSAQQGATTWREPQRRKTEKKASPLTSDQIITFSGSLADGSIWRQAHHFAHLWLALSPDIAPISMNQCTGNLLYSKPIKMLDGAHLSGI